LSNLRYKNNDDDEDTPNNNVRQSQNSDDDQINYEDETDLKKSSVISSSDNTTDIFKNNDDEYTRREKELNQLRITILKKLINKINHNEDSNTIQLSANIIINIINRAPECNFSYEVVEILLESNTFE